MLGFIGGNNELCSSERSLRLQQSGWEILQMRLSDLKTGQSAVIIKILGHGAFRKRVMEMGFIKGRKITALLVAPLRDPVKYRLMNYEVSLRRAEANMIEVMPLAPAENTIQ